MIEKNVIEDVLEARKYPTITFRSTAVEKVNEQQYQMAGQLDLHGVRKDLRFAIELKVGRATTVVLVSQMDSVLPHSALSSGHCGLILLCSLRCRYPS